MHDIRSFKEAEVRYKIIDPQLKKAGWNLADRSQIWFEVPVQGYDASPQSGITDYCLFRTNGDVLAVIEAKRTRRDARVGKEQVFQYVTEIEKKQSFRPFAFLANGDDVWFWDSDSYPERSVAGFFTREDLERLLHLKKNKLPLNEIRINEKIVNRSYQTEAIRRIGEALEKRKKRKALLVMATGTGKTRTIMALIDVFLRARQAQKVLFLADRDSLVEQALNDGFKFFIPNESRTRIRTYNIDKSARVYVSTLQTLEMCYEKFSPAEFDLIVTDECHRSIYNKYTDVLAYFDAVQIGLTATPAHFIDRDTFKFFETDGTAPTFLYTYDTAVKEEYLADYNVYSAQTKFQRKGIKGVDLSEEEQGSLRERGIDPEDINFEGTDLERKVTNKDTLHRQWEELMDVCHKDASGQVPAKTIVFAITQKHALRLEEAFNDMYPEHKGQLARVITSGVERASDLLAKFKKEDLPRIAISVDMLDTGVDVPEVMNLAFMKPVGSQIKFWQMIGRGTRSLEACRHFEWLPEKKKDNFLIVDFWENFDHFNMMPKDDSNARQIPVLVTIFNTRLSKLEILLPQGVIASGAKQSPEAVIASEAKQSPIYDTHPNPGSTLNDIERIIKELRNDISRIPLDSFTVKKNIKDVREAWDDDFWNYLTPQKIELLRMKLAPLLRFVPGVNLSEAFFTSKMERIGLLIARSRSQAEATKQSPAYITLIQSIREDVDLLPSTITQVQDKINYKEAILSNKFWQNPTLSSIDEAKAALAPLMKYKRDKPSLVIELGLDDVIDSRKWVVIREKAGAQKLMVEEYKRKVEEKIEQIASQHPVIQRLKNGESVNTNDLLQLETMLETELSTDELNLNEDNMLKAFGVRVGSLTDFLKHVLKLEALPTYEQIVRKAFDAFILEHNYNADQTRFLRTVQTVFMQKRKLEEADLYEAPFTNFGNNAVEKYLTPEEIEELMELTKKLAA